MNHRPHIEPARIARATNDPDAIRQERFDAAIEEALRQDREFNAKCGLSEYADIICIAIAGLVGLYFIVRVLV